MTFKPEKISHKLLIQGLCLKLAGLLHDLGKCNLQFQAKLHADGMTRERVRHEALSFFMFVQAVQPHLTRTTDELGWLRIACDAPGRLFGGLVDDNGLIVLNSKVLAAISSSTGEPGSPIAMLDKFLDSVLYNEAFRKKWPVFHTVAWLILTHHRLPGFNGPQYGTDERQQASLLDHVFSARPFSCDNLTTTRAGLPWEDAQWAAAFKATAAELHQLLGGESGLQAYLAESGLEVAHALRPSLILGDQLTSVMQEDVLKKRERKDVLLANTCRGGPGDSLVTHLRNVGRWASFVWNVVASPERWFPALAVRDLPATSLLRTSIPESSPFHWQERAATAVADVSGIESRPFFGVLMAAPGTGKTAAGPRILTVAAGGTLRWTLALGLKSLTLQSGAAYLDKLCIPAKDLATVVGDRAAISLFQAERQAEEEQSTLQKGSDSLDFEDNLEFYEDFSSEFGAWREALEPDDRITSDSRVFNEKLSRFIDAPVVACTVDNLVRVAELVRAGEARAFLRVANSDLILDEIDNYSPEDLVSLGKLVYMYGLFGRRVLLMSGTVAPQIAVTLQRAWYQGLCAFRARTGKSEPSITLFAGNLGQPCLLDEAEYSDFDSRYAQFAEQFACALDGQAKKVFAKPVLLAADSLFEDITQACFEFHAGNCVRDPESGSRFSIGFVRFNATRGSREFAQHLHARPDDPTRPAVRILCYHSRMPRLLRCLIELLLDKGLQRHAHEVPNHPVFRRVLGEANGRDVMVVVSTTSIQETGRDHDYDWAIVEPSSEQSAIQAAGRVRRHRTQRGDVPNFGVLSTTLRALRGEETPYGYTGVQDFSLFRESEQCLLDQPALNSVVARNLTMCGIHHEPVTEPQVILDSRQLLPVATWEKGLTPASAVRPLRQWESGRLAALNGVRLHLVLQGNEGEQTSLGAYLAGKLSSGEGLWQDRWHARQMRFREEGSQRSLEVELVDDTFDAFLWEAEDGSLIRIPFATEKIENPERALLRLDTELSEMTQLLLQRYSWPRTALRLLLRGEVALRTNTKNYLTKAAFKYHPLLGFGAV